MWVCLWRTSRIEKRENIHIIYTPNLGSSASVLSLEREQGKAALIKDVNERRKSRKKQK